MFGTLANSADPDQTPRSVQGLHCLLTGISIRNRIKRKRTPDTPKIRNGLIQMIRMDKSIRKLWVKL